MASLLKKNMAFKRIDSHTYEAPYHEEWNMANAVHGGSFAAILHTTATLHLTTTHASLDLPDIHTMQLTFLRLGLHAPMTIKITDLKLGTMTSFHQLVLSQKGTARVTATITSTSFSRPIGPSALTGWELHPLAPPVPDFGKLAREEEEENWIPMGDNGDLFPLIKRMTVLVPRIHSSPRGNLDLWHTWTEPSDASYLCILADLFPSLYDTMLETGAVYYVAVRDAGARAWAKSHPGKAFRRKMDTQDAQKVSPLWGITLTMDVEFKRRVEGHEALDWVYTRVYTRAFEGGKIDLDVTLCDREGRVVCLARQVLLVLEAGRRLKERKSAEEVKRKAKI